MTIVLLQSEISEAEVADVVNELDLEQFFAEMDGVGTTEVPTDAFIRRLIERFKITFETAREILYRVVESGKATLTGQYTLKIA